MVVDTLAALLLSVSGVSAHPLHTTFTEIIQDPATHAVTVTVRSFTDDLARALGIAPPAAGASAGLPDSALAQYVRSHLTLAARGGQPMTLRYTGQKQSADLTWIAFAVMPPAGLAGSTVTDRMQAELYPDQVNLVQASYGDRKQTLLFSPGDAPKTLP